MSSTIVAIVGNPRRASRTHTLARTLAKATYSGLLKAFLDRLGTGALAGAAG